MVVTCLPTPDPSLLKVIVVPVGAALLEVIRGVGELSTVAEPSEVDGSSLMDLSSIGVVVSGPVESVVDPVLLDSVLLDSVLLWSVAVPELLVVNAVVDSVSAVEPVRAVGTVYAIEDRIDASAEAFGCAEPST